MEVLLLRTNVSNFRYGTLPKGARIGAYLESLRQSGMTPEPVIEGGVESDTALESTSLSGTSDRPSSSQGNAPRAVVHNQQMLRSNSSHGGFNARPSRASPRSNQSQLRKAIAGNASVKSPANWSPVSDSPMRGATAPVTDFEFPPPPPLDEFPGPSSSGNRPIPSPRGKRKGPAESNKENLPERLGRSAVRRDASSDSCESEERRSLASPAVMNFNTPKSPVSPVSECRTLESPAVGSLSSPGSTLDDGRMKRSNTRGSPAEPIRPYQSLTSPSYLRAATSTSGSTKAKLELKLVNELNSTEESGPAAPYRSGNPATSGGKHETTGGESNPAAQLVSELFESLKAKSVRKPTSPLQEKKENLEMGKNEIDFKANLKKVKRRDEDQMEDRDQHEIDFKSSLKKTGEKNVIAKSISNEEGEVGTGIIDFKAKLKKSSAKSTFTSGNDKEREPSKETVDFKARLRKVSGNKPVVTVSATAVPTATAQADGDDNAHEEDKRKSTGSISSLRKMWESSNSGNKPCQQDPNQTHPLRSKKTERKQR